MKAFYDTENTRWNDDPQLSVVEVITRDDETGRTQVQLHVGGQAVGEIVEVSERATHLIAFDMKDQPLFSESYDELSFILQYETMSNL